ncbi:MAG: hypothetical protein NVSMB55_27200 [Mycobacteriales bacterium]
MRPVCGAAGAGRDRTIDVANEPRTQRRTEEAMDVARRKSNMCSRLPHAMMAHVLALTAVVWQAIAILLWISALRAARRIVNRDLPSYCHVDR